MVITYYISELLYQWQKLTVTMKVHLTCLLTAVHCGLCKGLHFPPEVE